MHVHYFQYVNPAYERLFGYTCDELLGQDAREVLHSDKNKSDLQDAVNASLKKGKVRHSQCKPEKRQGRMQSRRSQCKPEKGKVRCSQCKPEKRQGSNHSSWEAS